MAKYIPLDALVAEIEKRKNEWSYGSSTEAKYKVEAYKEVIELLDTIDVKEVDLEEEIQDHIRECLDVKFPTTDIELIKKDVAYTAKKFFELGMRVSNPITASDRGTAEEIIVNLKRVEQDYRIDLTKEIEWVRNQVKKGNSYDSV